MSIATTSAYWKPTRDFRSRTRKASSRNRSEPTTRLGRICRSTWELAAIVGIPLGIILAGIACAVAIAGSGLLLERLLS